MAQKKLTNKITDLKQRSPNGGNTATKYINYRLFAQVFRVPIYYCGEYFGGMPQEVYDLNMGDIPRPRSAHIDNAKLRGKTILKLPVILRIFSKRKNSWMPCKSIFPPTVRYMFGKCRGGVSDLITEEDSIPRVITECNHFTKN